MVTIEEVKERFNKGSQLVKIEVKQYTYWFDIKHLSMERYFYGDYVGYAKYYDNDIKFFESIKRVIKKL